MREVLKYLNDHFFLFLVFCAVLPTIVEIMLVFASLLGGITIGEIDMQGARF